MGKMDIRFMYVLLIAIMLGGMNVVRGQNSTLTCLQDGGGGTFCGQCVQNQFGDIVRHTQLYAYLKWINGEANKGHDDI